MIDDKQINELDRVDRLDVVDHRFLLDRLRGELEKLPLRHRIVIEMCYGLKGHLENYTIYEVARIYGTRVNYVESLRQEALKRLRRSGEILETFIDPRSKFISAEPEFE